MEPSSNALHGWQATKFRWVIRVRAGSAALVRRPAGSFYGFRLPGDSSIDTGMEWARHVEVGATPRFPLAGVASCAGGRGGCTVTHAAAGSRGRGACVGCPGTKGRSAGCGRQLRLEAPDPGIGLRRLGCQRLGISPGAAVSRRFAVVHRLGSCRAAAHAVGGGSRIRRGRWRRGRATSWRTAQAGRCCVGVRYVRRWRGPAGCRRRARGEGREAAPEDHGAPVDKHDVTIPNASWAEPAVDRDLGGHPNPSTEDRDQNMTLAPLVRVRHGPGGVPARRKRPEARPDFAPRRFHMPRQERGADAHPWDPRRPADAAQFCVAANPQMLRTRRSRRGIGPRRARIVRYSRIANCARKCTRSLVIVT